MSTSNQECIDYDGIASTVVDTAFRSIAELQDTKRAEKPTHEELFEILKAEFARKAIGLIDVRTGKRVI